RAKAVLKGGLWMADENPMSRAGRAAAQALIFGAPVPTDVSVEQMEAVTADDLRAVGARLLEGGRAATAVLGPRAGAPAGEAFSR
ncbi:hypothetical protein, partial [Pseudomonas aeruginosa]|uniref:hypothetical protein n=1 Tax=Pseudomonas aeruginosa TaxID=287 RepID=UPI002B401E06